jgi:Skp family chaperone for outer membrane proteins
MPTAGKSAPLTGRGASRAGKPENEETGTVQRKLFTLAGIAALGLAVYLGSRLHAQGPYQGGIQQTAASTGAAARTTIGVCNIQAVVRNYQKWLDLEKTFKEAIVRDNQQLEQVRQQGLSLKAQLDKIPEGDPSREKVLAELKAAERQIEDLRDSMKKGLAKFQEEQMVQIYREIQEAVTVCARARHIDLVLQYSDPTAAAEMYHPKVVMTKMANPWCLPIYVDPELDLTATVTQMLNSRIGANTNPNATQR